MPGPGPEIAAADDASGSGSGLGRKTKGTPNACDRRRKAQAKAMVALDGSGTGGETLLLPPLDLRRGTRVGPINGVETRADGMPTDPALPSGKRARNPLVPGRPNQPGQGTAADIARTERERRVLALARLGWSVRAIADAEGCGLATIHAILRERLAETTAALERETADTRARMLAGLEQQERTLSLIADGIATGGRAAPTYAEVIAANRALAAVRSQLAVLQGIRPAGEDTYTDWLASIAEADKRDGGADTVQAASWQEPARIEGARGGTET